MGQTVPEKLSLPADGAEVGVDLAGDVTLKTADYVQLGEPFFQAAFYVSLGFLMRAHAGEHDPPQGHGWPGGRRRG